QVLPRNEPSLREVLAAGSLLAPDPQVRLAALLALSEMPRSAEAAGAVAEALDTGAVDKDRWLTDAAVAAAAAHDLPLLEAVAAPSRPSRRPPGGVVEGVARGVADHYARGGPADSVGTLVTALVGADPRVARVVVTGLAAGWPKGRPAKLGAGA